MSEQLSKSEQVRRDPDLGKKFDSVLAKKYRLHVTTIARLRKEKGIKSAMEGMR